MPRGAAGGSWRYSADGQSQAQGFLSNIAGGDPGIGGFNVPTINTQPQSSPSITDSNCRWVRRCCRAVAPIYLVPAQCPPLLSKVGAYDDAMLFLSPQRCSRTKTLGWCDVRRP